MGRSEGGRRARLAGVGPHPRRRIRAGASARGARRRHALPRAQVREGAGHTRHGPQLGEEGRHSRRGRPGRAGPGQARPHGPGPRLKARRRHHLPQGAGGAASSRRRGRPVHAHGRRLGDLGAHGRGHRRRGARACPAARPRRRQRHTPFRPRLAARLRAVGPPGRRARGQALRRAHRRLPRRRGGGAPSPARSRTGCTACVDGPPETGRATRPSAASSASTTEAARTRRSATGFPPKRWGRSSSGRGKHPEAPSRSRRAWGGWPPGEGAAFCVRNLDTAQCATRWARRCASAAGARSAPRWDRRPSARRWRPTRSCPSARSATWPTRPRACSPRRRGSTTPPSGASSPRTPWGGAPDRPHTLNRYAYAASNPTRYFDPTGGFPLAVAGALAGGIFGAGIEAGKELLVDHTPPDQLNWGKIAAKGVEGAVTGGIAGLTCGASLGASIAANAGVGVLTDLADQTLVEDTARYNPPEAVVGHALVYGAWNGLSGATQYTTIGALANHVIAKEGVGLGLAKQLGLFSLYQLNSQPLIGGMMMLWERVTGYRASACAGEEV
ncbi:hypothetical protein HMPREF1316_2485 [Olsenella profusa F0195]|uniref:RHS repeat-associated core domain protein n=1 Tax=Olsenella profusa F0195 TaxID=1125712 RepID=U2TU88_9ACTN|nr:hypothetical protein HMPREF1316_2485 [Olsenella profusa F0195]